MSILFEWSTIALEAFDLVAILPGAILTASAFAMRLARDGQLARPKEAVASYVITAAAHMDHLKEADAV